MAKKFSQAMSILILVLVVSLNFPATMPQTTLSGQTTPSVCPYPCLPPPIVTTNCPPPPSLPLPPPVPPLPPRPPSLYPPLPPLPPSLYPPLPPGIMFAPPPPNPILPYFPWYYKNPPPPPNFSLAMRLRRSMIMMPCMILVVLFSCCL